MKLALILFSSVTLAQAGTAHAQSPTTGSRTGSTYQGPQWEYAIWNFTEGRNASDVAWITSDTNTYRSGTTNEEISKVLGGKGKGAGSIDVFDAAGKQGWEMVTCYMQLNSRVCVFKRQVRRAGS